MAGTLRAFLLAPSKAEQQAHRRTLDHLMADLPDAALADAAFRHSGARLGSFAFAQGAVVGALGNLLASAIGHFVDRAGAWTPRDMVWAACGLFSGAVIVVMTWGALQRYQLNTAIEGRFVRELRRRGVPGSALAEDEERESP